MSDLPWKTQDFNFNARVAYYLIMGVLGLIIVFSSFYTVEPDEQAVILRFGKYVSTEEPGLHFKLPLGVDNAIKVKTKLILQEEFGFRSQAVQGGQGARTEYSSERFDEESLMLTGDLNVADVEWIVQFQISDANKFLFRVRDPITTVRDISHAIMRRVVGDRLVTDVLTIGRTEIAAETTKLMQGVMDKYDIGIRIVAIKLQDVNPPEAVKASFNDVNSAKQEQEQIINHAEKGYNKLVPEMRGSAEKTISEAQGYALALVNRAKGDAEKFNSVLNEYQKAPDITRKRLYLDTMQEILGKVDGLTVVDPTLKGVIPLYDGNKSTNNNVIPIPASDKNEGVKP